MDDAANQTTAAVMRILDANLDRAREGMRIVEEWCRFGLNDGSATQVCKDIRQELGRWQTADIRAYRDTPGDPGTSLSHPQEEARANVVQVLIANFCRTQEALRVLEEFGKIQFPDLAAAAKDLRYQVYSLESQLISQQRHRLLQRSPLYLVTMPVDNIFATVEAALQGGLTLVQYRDKDTDDLQRFHIAQKLCQLCHQYNALFIVNDRVDLALAVNADGVHLGQQDMPISFARQLLGSHRLIGRSTTNPDELHRALNEDVDYVGVGPVYETPTKAGKAAAGHDYVRYAAEHSTVPWFAIGGINADNVQSVIEAGAKRVSVVRAIMQAPEPTLTTQFFLAQLGRSHPTP